MLQPEQTYWDHADVHCLSNVQDLSEKALSLNFGKTLIHESLKGTEQVSFTHVRGRTKSGSE